jgi:predicted MPP superfamily phosphohydrolase
MPEVDTLKRNWSKRMIIFFVLIAFAVIYVYTQNNWIEVEYITVEIDKLPKELEELKIVHISDVHIPHFPAGIKKLISSVQKEQPDIIILTGDILDSGGDLDDQGLIELCNGLSRIANIYAVTGNHETRKNDTGKWAEVMRKNNVTVVDNRIEVFNKDNASVAIMGLKDNHRYSYEYLAGIESVKDMPRILLAHRPELFGSYSSDANDIKPDLIFCGHAHGGQFRIPFINKGIIAPHQGLFPKYTSGLYVSDNRVQMVVSRGLGSSIIPIRLNNRPHLPVVRLKSS